MNNIELLDLINKGGLLIWPILLCSIVGTAIFFERFALYRNVLKRKRNNHPAFKLIRAGKFEEARQFLHTRYTNNSPDTRILVEAINMEKPDHETLEIVLAHGVEREMSSLSARLNTLAVLGSVSPLLGLLGTVIGMIKAFMVVQNMGGSVNATVLAGGIWEAMLTTAFGLLAAIPLLFFHNHLEGKLHDIQAELEEVAIAYMKAWSGWHNNGGKENDTVSR